MHFTTLALSALATFAAAVPADITNRRANVPDLPNGFFSGVNHANGTTTMTFENGESFNFVPTLAETSESSLQKRVYFDCWKFQGELNHAGVDAGVRNMNDRLNVGGFWLGSPKGPPYWGYNNNGVYVYFCRNSRDNTALIVNKAAMDFANSQMDGACGLYQAGYMQFDNSPLIYGKTISGTAVCLGGV